MGYSPSDDVGCKRPSDDNGVGPSSKTPKIEALADAIVNDTPVYKKLPVLHNKALPSPDKDFQKLPSPPLKVVDEVLQKLSSPPSDEVSQTSTSPPKKVVDEVFKLPRTKKDLIGYSDDDNQESDSTDDMKYTDNSSDDQESSSESNNNSIVGSSTEEREANDNSSADKSRSSATNREITENAKRSVIKFLPKTVKGLEKRFNTRFVEFTRHGKHEHRNELVALLDEMLRKNAIKRNEYMKLNDLIASSLPDDGNETDIDDTFMELYKRFENEGKKQQKIDLVTMLDELKCRDGISKKHYETLKKRIEWIGKNPISIVKRVTNKIIKSDVKELRKILTDIKENAADEEKIDQLERLLGAGDFIDGEPSLPIILKAIDNLDDVVPKSTVYRLKDLVNDIEKNKYRIVTVFNRLQNARGKEDEKNILKQLASEELLSAEQYDQLNQLKEIEPRSIAIIIKGTKIGRGLKLLPTGSSDLKDKLMEALKDYSKNAPALKRVVKLLDELSERDGISKVEYEAIKKDLNVL